MIKSPRDFDGALKGFTEVVEKVKQAKSMPEVSALERQGRSAMREVQISAGYIGYRLKEAVDEARARINKELWAGIHNPQPVENSQQSVEKSTPQTVQSVKKSKGRPKKTAKSTKKEK